MPKSKPSRDPKYRLQTTTSGDRAFVVLGGRRHYLGAYGSPESQQTYHRLLAEYILRQEPVIRLLRLGRAVRSQVVPAPAEHNECAVATGRGLESVLRVS